jgi:conjugative relaxase-like TrwC/TraI family protein
MRVTTLRASADGLAGLLAYYAGLAEDRTRADGSARGPVDYYLDPDEPPGRWRGRGLRAVGLAGEVEGDDLRSLLEGRHPEHRGVLGRRFGDRSARGFDATFSAPKSVSALWALTPDRFVRAEVLAAHDAAVDAALGWFETHGAVTRRGTDGVHQVDTHGIVAALFRQHTSRTVDPQLHTHAVVTAKVQDPTGRWLSLDARFLMRQQTTIGWIYDAALRAELTHRLGVTWEQVTEGPVDMTCVPEPVREVLSQRSAQVKAKLHELIDRWSVEHGGADPDPRKIAALERKAAVSSRPGKVHGVDGATLHDTWAAQARTVGCEPEALTPGNLADRVTERHRSDDEVIAEALCRVSGKSSTWLRADLARHIATLVPLGAGSNAIELVARIDRLAAQAENSCLGLAPDRAHLGSTRRDGRPVAEHVTDRRLSTAPILDQEIALQQWAQRYATPVDPSLNSAQAAAEAIAGTSALVLVVGPAGTGKTTTTARAVRSLQDEGRPVIGLAPSGKAADVLTTEARCPTDTLAGFLTRHQQRPSGWRPGTTVILDEAGMASTDDFARLVDLIRRHRWRLVVVGDPAQLPAVGRGGVFAHWCATLPHHELVTPRRFEQPWEAAASIALRAGDPRAADTYAGHGRLLSAHPALIARDVARIHHNHATVGRTVAITTNTADTARAINTEIQRVIDPVGRRPRLRLGDGTHVSVGDQIATRRNHPALRTDQDEQVRNRHNWTVTRIDPGGDLAVAHPERGTVTLPASYVSCHVELGWAVTGYGNQGDTVDIGLAVLEPGTTRNHAYVALTRGRSLNVAWVPDPTGTLDPADQLAAIITHSADHESALAIRARLHREAGLTEPPITPEPELSPSGPSPAHPVTGPSHPDPTLDERVRAIQARFDNLQQRSAGRSLSR